MWANKIIDIFITILAIVVVPVQLVTTLVLGLLVSLTGGLLLYTISLIWVVLFLGPLLWLYCIAGRNPQFQRLCYGFAGVAELFGDISLSFFFDYYFPPTVLAPRSPNSRQITPLCRSVLNSALCKTLVEIELSGATLVFGPSRGAFEEAWRFGWRYPENFYCRDTSEY